MTKRETIDIYELIELLHVPLVENRLYLKIEELKNSEYENNITLYRQRVETYKRILYDTRRKQNEQQGTGQLYWFELTRYKGDEWKVTRIDPQPPPFFEIPEIIPEDIIKLIDLSLTNPEVVESKQNVTSDTFGKNYDLKFVRCSGNHAFGTICETSASTGKELLEVSYTENEKVDIALKLFFSYMRKFPSIRNYFLNEFFSKIKLMCEEGNEDFSVT